METLASASFVIGDVDCLMQEAAGVASCYDQDFLLSEKEAR